MRASLSQIGKQSNHFIYGIDRNKCLLRIEYLSGDAVIAIRNHLIIYFSSVSELARRIALGLFLMQFNIFSLERFCL